MAANHIDLWQEAIRLHNDGVPFCTVTVADARGSIPQEIGAKALMNRDGLVCGTIGGGRVEVRGCAKARELLAPDLKQRTLLERINLHKDVGMTCAGEMTLLYEVFRPDLEWNIAVFGAGHVSQKLCRLLIELECRVTCFDSRSERPDRLPQSARLERRLVKDFADGIHDIPRGAFVVVMTMVNPNGPPGVAGALRVRTPTWTLSACSVAILKAAIMRRELLAAGVEEAFVARIGCPLGEKIGDNTPSDIAVSILALLVRLRRKLADN